MIHINCNNCRTQLSIDDAFAGGVCRCQYCGTIQTVPAHLKNSGGSPSDTIDHAAASGKGNGAAKTLYQKKGAASASPRAGSGLDDLAGVVASSGLSGSGLGERGLRKSSGTAPKNKMLPILLGAGGIIAALVAVIIWMALRGTAPQISPGPSDGGTPNVPVNPPPSQAPVASAQPTFLGADLSNDNTVVYLIDRGQGSSGYFDRMKQAVMLSLGTLGSDRRFQVIFWDNSSEPLAYPTSGPLLATKDNIEACRKAIEDVVAAHQSSLDEALPRAIKSNPDAIMLVTAKILEPDFAKRVLDLRGASPVRIDCFYLGQTTSDDNLQKIAKTTGGEEYDLGEH